MRCYSEAVKADVRRWMSPPYRQSVAQISAELGIHVVTFYNWIKTWRLEGQVVSASQKDPEVWGPTDKFTVDLETAGLNTTDLSAYCLERVCIQSRRTAGARPPRMRMHSRWLLTMAE